MARHAPHTETTKPHHSLRFALGVGLNVVFVLVEIVFGVMTDSMALLADAGHNAGDVLGLALAWAAAHFARRHPSRRHTYGLGRSTVLASLANASLLLFAMGAIAWESATRLFQPAPIETPTVLAVAAVGVVINTITALLFLAGRKDDLNIRGAFLHMAADAGVSLAVVAGAVAILYTGALWLDPLMSLLIVVVIVVCAWRLLREALRLALDAVPPTVDLDAVERFLQDLPGVVGHHDLHVWALSTTRTALTVHLVRPDPDAGLNETLPTEDALLAYAEDALQRRFGIHHATFQLERGGFSVDNPDA